MAITTQDRILIETRISNDGPSTGVAYLLWFFLSIFSAHRFYLGRPGSAVLQILSYFVLVGFLWVLIDAFLIPGMVRSKKDEMRKRMIRDVLSHTSDERVSYDMPNQQPSFARMSRA